MIYDIFITLICKYLSVCACILTDMHACTQIRTHSTCMHAHTYINKYKR
jgi:hypothetical protein